MGFAFSFPKSSSADKSWDIAEAFLSTPMKKLPELLLKKAVSSPRPVDKASASAALACILSFGSNLCKPEAVELLANVAARFCLGLTLLSWNLAEPRPKLNVPTSSGESKLHG